MRFVLKVLFVIAALYIVALILLYFLQERLIFFPQKLDARTKFSFPYKFEDRSFRMKDGTILNGLLFKADSARGLMFYLHGNAGSLESWGEIAPVYTSLHYDLFIPDYRGYGKSEGHISSESQLHDDIQTLYNTLKQQYDESNIIVLGYSIGSGLATRLASNNRPRMLILQAPYYSLVHMMRSSYPYIPTALLKYRLETNKWLAYCKKPIVLFHGDKDRIIPYEHSVKLKSLLKPDDTMITLKGVGHNGMSDNPAYLKALSRQLER